jgi:hypothetical protein
MNDQPTEPETTAADWDPSMETDRIGPEQCEALTVAPDPDLGDGADCRETAADARIDARARLAKAQRLGTFEAEILAAQAQAWQVLQTGDGGGQNFPALLIPTLCEAMLAAVRDRNLARVASLLRPIVAILGAELIEDFRKRALASEGQAAIEALLLHGDTGPFQRLASEVNGGPGGVQGYIYQGFTLLRLKRSGGQLVGYQAARRNAPEIESSAIGVHGTYEVLTVHAAADYPWRQDRAFIEAMQRVGFGPEVGSDE